MEHWEFVKGKTFGDKRSPQMKECNFAGPNKRKALDNLCNLLHRAAIRYWRVKVCKDFTKWYKSEKTEIHTDNVVPVWEAGIRVVEKSTLCL